MDLLTANDRPGTYPGSFYAEGAAFLPPFDPAQGDLRADVCVVGGGFTGLSAALHLAQAGYDVVLLEAQRLGFGASGRNGGQVGQGQRLEQDTLEQMLGEEHARALWDIARQSVNLVRDLAAQGGVAFYPGIVHADHRARYVPHSHAYAEHLNTRYGYDQISALDRDQIQSLVQSPAYYGGTLDMGAGHLDPLAFALALARMAQAAGVRIYEGSRVTGLTEGPPAIVQTDQARIRADHVVVGCNGYLGGLQPEVAARVMPLNNYIVATRPLSAEERATVMPCPHAVADSKFVVNYFRMSPDNRLLFGGTESYGYRFPTDIATQVRRPLGQIFPQIRDIQIDYAWGGTLGITLNRMPCFQRVNKHILSMSGYSGHGVAIATMAGQIAADAIAGRDERFDLMARVPSPRFPGGVALRQPLLVLAMLWYGLRDRL